MDKKYRGVLKPKAIQTIKKEKNNLIIGDEKYEDIGVKGAKIIKDPINPAKNTRFKLASLFKIKAVHRRRRLSNKKFKDQMVSI